METTNNTTLTTAAAWRAAISLTCADVRAFLSSAFEVLKAVALLVYILVAFCLTFNESETLLPNLAGITMFLLAYLYVNKEKNNNN